MAKYEISMTEGSVLKNHLRFAFPLMASSVLQLLYSAADQVVVGRFSGSSELAAIGATGSLNLLLINLFLGLSVGAGIAVSRRYGAGDLPGLKKVAHTAVGLSLVMGFVAMVFGLVFCRPLLEFFDTPTEIIELSTLYMRILFVGAPFVMIYNFGASILRAVGDTKRPLYILSATGVVNVVLNLVLVIVFHLGVAGVAIATITANFLSAAAVLYTLCNSDSVYRISLKNLRITKNETIEFIKIGLPAGCQSIMYNISNAVIQSAINSMSVQTVAGNTAATSIEGFIYVATNAFYQSTLTSVGQNYGAKNKKRIYSTLWVGIACTSVVGIILGVLAVYFSDFLLGFYIVEPIEAIKIGASRMVITSLPYFLLGIMEQLAALLNGLGKTIYAAVNAFVGTCLFRVIWVLAIFPLNPRIDFLYISYPVSWILTILIHFAMFMCIKKKVFQKMME